MTDEMIEKVKNAKGTREIKGLIESIEITEYAELVALLEVDTRKTVQTIVKQLSRKYTAYLSERERMKRMYEYENDLKQKGFKVIAGLDEAGRGPLIGPVVAAVVVLDEETDYFGINDSKKLNATQREQFYNLIVSNASGYGIGMASHEEIDEINILNATKLAMKRAIESLKATVNPDFLLLDALEIHELETPQLGIVKGDSKSASIAAASILAKVTRDRVMQSVHMTYPHYGFDTNMGYGTDAHYEGIRKFGLTPLHRRTFVKPFL